MGNTLRKQFSHTVMVPGDLAAVFASLCPVAELDWAPGWNAVMVYSASGKAERGCVFTTRHDPMPTMVWVCSVYDLNQEVEYIRVVPDHFVTVVNIKTSEVGGQTQCVVTYTHTALSAGGAAFMGSHLTEQSFKSDIDEWPAQIAAYLAS